MKIEVNSNPETYLKWDSNTRLATLFPQLGYTRALYVITHPEGEPPADLDTVEKFDAYFDEMELKYRRMFADQNERNTKLLEGEPYLMLEDLYLNGEAEAHITKMELTESEKENLYFVFEDALQQVEVGKQLVVPTLAGFQSNWEKLTCGMFKHVNFENVFIAGGAVVAALQPDFDGLSESSHFFNSDIDVFLYGLELDQVEEKCIEIYEGIMKAVSGIPDFVAEMGLSMPGSQRV
jgi:hypothetical protein